MPSPKRILVATDFSEPAAKALEAAIALAAKSRAEVHLIHAVEVALPLFEPYAVVIPADWVGEARRLAQEKLAKAHEVVKARGLTGTTHLGDVPAAHAIAERARELGADLVVVGTHGHTGLKHALLGSVAERTVEYSPCSVWTVKGERAAEPRTIVVGADFSKAGERALAVAADWAKRFGAKVHLVHALHLPIPLVAPYEVVIPEGVIEGARRDAQRQLEQTATTAFGGLVVTTELASTPAHAALADAAKRLAAELIVTGSRGLTGLKHALLGSVAERTLRYAPCAVLTVRGASL